MKTIGISIPKRVMDSLRLLIANVDGPGNHRFNTALCAVLESPQVAEVLASVIDDFLVDQEALIHFKKFQDGRNFPEILKERYSRN